MALYGGCGGFGTCGLVEEMGFLGIRFEGYILLVLCFLLFQDADKLCCKRLSPGTELRMLHYCGWGPPTAQGFPTMMDQWSLEQ